jgi:hypothetical protein
MLINCTPHPIRLQSEFGIEEFLPSGIVPRVVAERVLDGTVACYPVYAQVYGEVEGLPPINRPDFYIVSGLVLTALKGTRYDCVAPDTSPEGAIRDAAGRITAVRGFVR